MFKSVYDLKVFYASATGTLARRLVARGIAQFWQESRDERIAGIGYATPYLDAFLDRADRCFAVTPAGHGAHSWPENRKNLTVLAEDSELPFETNSLDKIVLIHALEHAERVDASLGEIWRVLKSNGRLLIVVPNRRGFWSRSDRSPFGQGTPYSINQLRSILRENLFVYERHRPALFTPPFLRKILFPFADTIEKIGPYTMPAFAGLHVVEASKQLYAGINVSSGSRVKARGRGELVARPVPLGRI
jgi:SAM-dependent methyltransferase